MDSAAPMNPTGQPTIAAGRGRAVEQHLQQVEQRGRGVADRDDRARRGSGSHSETAAAVRVVLHSRGQAGHPLVAAGSRARRCPAGSRPRGDARWRPCGRRSGSARPASARRGRAATRPGWMTRSRTRSTWPRAVDHPDGELLGVGGQAVERRLAADRRERVDVDRRAVVDVVVAARSARAQVVIGASVGHQDAAPRRDHQLAAPPVDEPRRPGRGRGRRRAPATCSPPGDGAVRPAAAPRPRCAGRRGDRVRPAARQLVDVPGRVGPVAAHAAGTRRASPTSAPGASAGRRPAPTPRADPQLRRSRRRGRPGPRSSDAVDQVAAAVVEHEQEPSGQLGQRRRRRRAAVEVGGHRAQVGAAAGAARSAARP